MAHAASAFPMLGSPNTNNYPSRPNNQREHDADRHGLLHSKFVGKPTAYVPHGTHDDHPLDDPFRQLHARLHALRDVREKLRFVPSHALPIATRVALSAPTVNNDNWVQHGGITALDGLETLVLSFLSTHELVTAGAVCQSWHALSRRDELWEPLLHTPIEKYPLRAFLGFDASVPAVQVYIIYRKVRAQLQTLDAKDDEAPRQSPDAVRFEELLLRFRRAGNNNQNNQNNNQEHDAADDLELFARAHGHPIHDDLPVPLTPPRRTFPLRRRVNSGSTTTTTTPKLYLRSVHLVFPTDEDLDAESEPMTDTPPLQAAAPAAPAMAFDDPLAPFQAMVDIESDDEGVEDIVMLTPDEPPAAVPVPTSVLAACRRVRLQTWLAERRVVSREEFRAFARQLLIALATLEASQIAHSDVALGNILVLDRSATRGALPESNQQRSTEADAPLFQLYCRSSVNTWTVPRPTPTTNTLQHLADNPPPVPMARGFNGDALALRMRHRHHRLLAVMGAALDAPDGEDHLLLRRHLLPRPMARAGVDDDDFVIPPLPPMPAAMAVAPLPTRTPSSASYSNMVRSYIRILREVWSHGRVASITERALPFLSLIFLRPDVVTSTSTRSFLEYAEYLLSRNDATPSKLLNHVFLHDASLPTTAAASPQRGRRVASQTRSLIGRSALNPSSFSSGEDYRAHAIAWYARHMSSRPTPPVAPSLASFGALGSIPSTLFGPAFFHDALSENRLPCQRFLSVAAPRTATSSWVHTLVVSQRFTLQQLDLSRVQLPLSILMRELQHLQRLSHLRLPRAILRDENMEEFIAALWCDGLLPTLEVMDDVIRVHLDRMEAGYVSQLEIMASFLDANRKQDSAKRLHHTFSSPF